MTKKKTAKLKAPKAVRSTDLVRQPMKVKSIIFYASTKPDCTKMCVVAHHRKTKKPFAAYLRTEVVDADAWHALDMAKPQPGETVLNTIEL